MNFIDKPISILSMGLRNHEAIQQPFSSEIRKVMKKYDWTCCRCGIKIPGLMQIDHTAGHAARNAEGFRPICAFCHDQDHLIWAASCKKIVPIIATTEEGVLSNEDISLMSWSLFAMFTHQNDDPDANDSVAGIMRAFQARRGAFQEKYGSKDADSFIEATYRFLDGAEDENENMLVERQAIVERTLAEVRFVPAFMAGHTKEDEPSTFLSTWGPGGFSSIEIDDAKTIRSMFPSKHKPADMVSGVKDIIMKMREGV